MLNKKKVVLIVSKELIHDFNFEGVQIIQNIFGVEKTWRNNKTPMVLSGSGLEWQSRAFDYEVIEISDHTDEESFISICHQNGIECGEPVRAKKFDTSKESCFLCKCVEGSSNDVVMYNATIDEKNIILCDTENFFVTCEVGCMQEGMLMINPKKHIMSTALIPEEHVKEYEQLKADTEFILKSVYGDKPVIFFEHGSAEDGFSTHKRSIVHAHTHVAWGVPFEQKYLDMVSLKPMSVESLKGKKYLSYQEGTKGVLLAVTNPEVYVQRQYPRQVIGEMLGIPNDLTNWRVKTFSGNIHKMFYRIYEYITDNKAFLSERIINETEGFIKGYSMRN